MPHTHTEIVHYSGHVQGVGFRYTTLQVAREFAVTGEVKNLPDGRVRLLVQGDKSEVRAFRESLEERMAAFIRETQAEADPAHPFIQTFEIAR